MTSSVNVDDNLRDKIKKLAVDLDTSQRDVVARGVDLLEKSIKSTTHYTDLSSRKFMSTAAEQRKNVKWRQKIRKKLKSDGLPSNH